MCKKIVMILFLGIVLAPNSLVALTDFLIVDIPSDLSLTTFQTHQIIRNDDGVYSLETELANGAQLSSLHLRTDGTWLFSPSFPLNLDETNFEPRDIVSFNGLSYSMVLDGSAVGIPENARIDSLFLDSSNNPVLGFDVPVELGGSIYSRNDLTVYSGSFSLYWDAEAAGVPVSANITGVTTDDSLLLIVTFAIPTDINSVTYLPGQLVQWNGSLFSSYYLDATWPPASVCQGITFPTSSPAGAVPDVSGVPGSPLTVTLSGNDIILDWDVSCLPSDSDYAIYEGVIGNFSSHSSVLCSTGGLTTESFTPMAGSTYYLVVPLSGTLEGSYGYDSSVTERPASSSPCMPQGIAPCP